MNTFEVLKILDLSADIMESYFRSNRAEQLREIRKEVELLTKRNKKLEETLSAAFAACKGNNLQAVTIELESVISGTTS